MTDDRKDLPQVSAVNFLERTREAVQEYLGKRGDPLNRGLTVRDLLTVGLIQTSPGYGSSPYYHPIQPGPAIKDEYVPDLTPPPAPTGVVLTPGISYITIQHDVAAYPNGHGHADTLVYGVVVAAGDTELPTFEDALHVATFSGEVFSYACNPGQTWHFWLKWRSKDGVLSEPAGGLHGYVTTTGQDVGLLLDVLEGSITESQLHQQLSTRIDLIDGTGAGSVNDRIAAEAAQLGAAVQAETAARTQAIEDEVASRIAAVQAEAEARQQGDSDVSALVFSEELARQNADSAEAVARQLLSSKLLGTTDPAGVGLGSLTSGVLYDERIARSQGDQALSQQITMLSAGAGEQFDYLRIWYFDSSVEGWTGVAAPTWASTWIRPGNSATACEIDSPAGLAVNTNTYNQVRLRIRKTGSPTWSGRLWWKTEADSAFTEAKSVTFSQPVYDSNGIGLVTINPTWAGAAVDSIRLTLATSQAAGAAFEADWVAIGRPSPGASAAALLDEQLARATADSAESSARQALSTKLVGTSDPASVTLATVTSGLIYDERVARANADASEVAARQQLAAQQASDTATLTSAVNAEQTARTNADTALGQRIDTVVATATQDRNNNTAAIQAEATARANADTANAQSVTTLQAEVRRTVSYTIRSRGGSATAGSNTIVKDDGTVVATAGRSYCVTVLNGSTAAVVSATTFDVYADPANAALMANHLNALASDKVVIVSTNDEPQTNRLAGGLAAAMYRCGASGLVYGTSAFMYRSSYILVGIPGIGEGGGVERYAGDTGSSTTAYCEYVLQLVNGRPVALGGNPYAAAISQEMAVRASQTGDIFARYTIKMDLNGYVAGIGLIATSNSAQPSSAFAIRADSFYVANPEGPGIAPSMPFVVRTSAYVNNGITVQPGVYMRDAFIENGTVTNAKIANLAVDDAKIANLAVSKLTAGALSVGAFIKSTNYASGSAGWTISSDGQAEFNNVVVRGGVYASYGSFSGTVYASSGSFTGTVNATNGSFTGHVVATSGSFTGAVNATSGSFTGSIKASNFMTGGYWGYAWPPAGQAGCYLGPEGLLIGNYNNGKYVQFTQDGNMYAPGMSIVNGNLTISQLNCIGTHNILQGALTQTFNGSATNNIDLWINNDSNRTATVMVIAKVGGFTSYVRFSGDGGDYTMPDHSMRCLNDNSTSSGPIDSRHNGSGTGLFAYGRPFVHITTYSVPPGASYVYLRRTGPDVSLSVTAMVFKA